MRTLFCLLLTLTAAAADVPSFDYQLLATNRISTMEKEMNQAAASGFRYSQVVGGDPTFGGQEVVVMSKPLNGAAEPAKTYRVFSAALTSNLEKELQRAGDKVSLFVHGTGGPLAPNLLGMVAHFGQCAASVGNASLINGLVYQVDMRLPTTIPLCAGAYGPTGIAQFVFVHLSYGDIPVGPATLTGSPMILGIWAQ